MFLRFDNFDDKGVIRWIAIKENGEIVYLQKILNCDNACLYMNQMRYINAIYSDFFNLYFKHFYKVVGEDFFSTFDISNNQCKHSKNLVFISFSDNKKISWIAIKDINLKTKVINAIIFNDFFIKWGVFRCWNARNGLIYLV